MYFDLIGFEGFYKISRDGVIVSIPRNGTIGVERKIKQSISNNGYLKVSLRKNGVSKTMSVHRILAKTFIDNPDDLPCVNHIDGNKLNNSLSNLEWVTHSGNIQHAYDNNLTKPLRGEGRSMLKNEEVLAIVEMKNKGKTLKYISDIFEVSPSTVSDIVSGRTWSHVTGIELNPNKFKGKKSLTGEKGVIPSHNGKFDIFSFYGGKNVYMMRIGDLRKAREAKKMADELLSGGMEIKQVVAALRSIFK